MSYHAFPIPPAPNAASLGKFGAIPVNTYTGIPNVQVPLYVVRQGMLSVPITLAYHSAIKVVETPSWVGLGWTLQAGGAITQTIRGASDQLTTGQGYWNNKALVDSLNPRWLDSYHYGYQNQVAAGRHDLQPDSYFYNLPLGTGQLLFTDSTHAGAVAERGLSARFLHRHFELTDRAGTRYLLGDTPTSRDYSVSDDQESPTRGGTGAYYLTAMISANRQDTIRFCYITEDFTQDLATAEEVYYQPPTLAGDRGPDLPNVRTTITQSGTQCRLTEIRWRNGRVVFTAAANRPDVVLPGGQAAQALSRLDVYTRANELVKSYAFTYGAFYSNNDPFQAQNVPGTIYAPTDTRLKLLAVTEQHGAQQLPGYRFLYYEHQGLPPRTSYQQDHWGFANRNTKATLLPATYLPYSGGAGVYPDGGNRNPDFASALAGVLRQITYPTGGRTVFVYEPHRAAQAGQAPATTVVATPHPLAINTSDFTNVPYGDDFTRQFPFTLAQPAGVNLTYSLRAQGGTGAMASISFKLTQLRPNPTYNQVWASGGLIDDGHINPSTQTAGQTLTSPTPPPTLNLPAGQYVLTLTGNIESRQIRECWGRITLTLYETVVDSTALNQGILVGGTRIKRITDIASSGADSTVTHYTYTKQVGGQRVCSGVLVKNPIYDIDYKAWVHTLGNPSYYPPQLITYKKLSSSALAGIGSTQGSHIGYGHVQVSHTNGALDSGYEDYTYTTAAEYPDLASFSPYAPPSSRDWLRGTLVRHDSYTSTGQLVRRVRSIYTIDQRATEQLSGVVLHRIASEFPPGGGTPPVYNRYWIGYFRDRAQWKYESRRITTTYDPLDSTRQMSQWQAFRYDNPQHGLLTQTQTQGPAGEVRVHHLRYPLDFSVAPSSSAGPEAGIAQLQAAHVWSPVLEESEWLKPVGRADSLVVRAQLHTYRPRLGRPVSLEDRLYTLTLPSPSLTYLPAGVGAAGWQQDPRYEERERYRQYDRFDNLTWVTRAAAASRQVVLWSNDGTDLLAQASNCTPAQLASTSFEQDAPGRWHYDSTSTHRVGGGRTGRWAYQLDGQAPVYREQLPAGEYVLECWVQGVSNVTLSLLGATADGPQLLASAPAAWRHYRWRLHCTGQGQVSLDSPGGGTTLLVDEVRLYPVGSLLTSYVHEPLIGLSAQTGPDGRTHTFEYDAFGRLVRTRDEQGRILGQQQYHYAGQQ